MPLVTLAVRANRILVPNVTDLCLGAILDDLVKYRAELVERFHKEIKFAALVRNTNHVEVIRQLEGVHVVIPDEATLSEPELLAKFIADHARTADITINAADSDNVELTEAILEGQKARVVEDKKERAALLHTSGVAVFAGEERDGRHHPVDPVDPASGHIWNVRY